MDLFSKYATVVDVTILIDRETGHMKGFAFIYIDAGSQAHAIAKCDGADFMGHTLCVNPAVEGDGTGEGGVRGGGRGGVFRGGRRGGGSRGGFRGDRRGDRY